MVADPGGVDPNPDSIVKKRILIRPHKTHLLYLNIKLDKFREAAKKFFFGGPDTKRGGGTVYLKVLFVFQTHHNSLSVTTNMHPHYKAKTCSPYRQN